MRLARGVPLCHCLPLTHRDRLPYAILAANQVLGYVVIRI